MMKCKTLVARIGISLILLLSLSSCGTLFEKSKVSSRFEAIHGCPPESVNYAGGGYTVKGCGTTAYFTCFSTRDSDNELFDQILIGSDTCIQEYAVSEQSFRSERSAEMIIPEIREDTLEDGRIRLQALFSVEKGKIVVIGVPGRLPDRILIAYIANESLPQIETCSPQLWIDGESRSVELLVSKDNRRHVFAIEAPSLIDIENARRIFMDICGVRIVLPATSSSTLADFYIRFKEERSRDAAI